MTTHTYLNGAIDLRPLVIRDRGPRHAVAWLAAEYDVPEHQVIATHAAIEL
ncbi:hypothetical protein [Microbacterium sp. LBN7]|uniref:hypothetical protein n=1 Tax=Microbacterium sp. LBN7 TaxID=3129773 RepID=UPI00324FB027